MKPKQNELIKTKRELNKEGDPIRVPRQKGLTMALLQAHTHKNQEILDNIKQNLIETWITTGLTLNGEVYNAEQLSTYLNLPITTILKRTQGAMNRLGSWLKDGRLQETTRAIFSQALFGILETQALTKAQAKLLLAEQGDQYVPFLTTEANKSLANLIASHKPIADLLNILKPAQTSIPAHPDTPASKHTITPDEAITLIRDNTQSMIQDTNQLDARFGQLQLEEHIPDVNARNQDLSSIGIRQKALSGPTSSKGLKAPKDKGDDVPIPSQHRKRIAQTIHNDIILPG